MTRNPKDIAVSYYHYCKLIHDFHGTLEEFCELFLKGKSKETAKKKIELFIKTYLVYNQHIFQLQ